MQELSENPSEIDKYLYSLIVVLRTKYHNVSVNRQRNSVQFFYSKTTGTFKWCQFTLSNAEILGYYMMSEIPKEIKMLIEEK